MCRDGAGVRPALAWRWMQQRRSVAQQGARRTWPIKRRLPRRRPWRNGSARSQHGASRVRIRHKVHLACRSTRKGRCSTCTGGVSSMSATARCDQSANALSCLYNLWFRRRHPNVSSYNAPEKLAAFLVAAHAGLRNGVQVSVMARRELRGAEPEDRLPFRWRERVDGAEAGHVLAPPR